MFSLALSSGPLPRAKFRVLLPERLSLLSLVFMVLFMFDFLLHPLSFSELSIGEIGPG